MANWIFFKTWTWAGDQLKTNNWSAVNLKKHVKTISCAPEPVIRSYKTGQRTPYFDSCQLNITWMSKIKLNTDCIYSCRATEVVGERKRNLIKSGKPHGCSSLWWWNSEFTETQLAFTSAGAFSAITSLVMADVIHHLLPLHKVCHAVRYTEHTP